MRLCPSLSIRLPLPRWLRIVLRALPNVPLARLNTVKRFNNIAQGRREAGAPWVHSQSLRGTPTGSDNTDGHVPWPLSLMTGALLFDVFNPVGVGCCIRCVPRVRRVRGDPGLCCITPSA